MTNINATNSKNFFFHICAHLCAVLLMTILLSACRSSTPATLAQLPSHYVHAADCQVHYKTCGDGDVAVLFVHGFGCDMNAWEKQYETFRDNDSLRFIFIDLPGFGKSDKSHADYTLDYFSQAVEQVLQAEQVEEAVLVGHSLGTPVCLWTTRRGNVSVAALCDVDGVYCLYPEDTVAAALYEQAVQGFASSFCGDDVRQNITDFVHSLAGPATPQEITDYALSTMPNTPDYVACSTMSHLIEHRYWDTWKPLTIPALVVCTENSGIEADNREQMRRFYAEMDYWQLDTCGHFIAWEQAEAFNQRLRQLLSAIR